MANIQITQLPAAGSITGTELVPIVQNGVTVQTTTGAIAASPSQTQTFLTKNQEPTLPNSRALSGGDGIGLVDGGAQSTLQITLNGASGSLEAAGTGIIAKTAGATVTPRTLSTTGNGIEVTNGNGVSGDPTFALTGLAAALANASGTGMLAVVNGATIAGRQITGTATQIDVASGNGSGNPTLSISDNAEFPGTEGITIPAGTTAQRPSVPNNGELRYNTSLQRFEAYVNGEWQTIGSGDGTISSVAGTIGQISVANGTTMPTVSIYTNPTLPGTEYVKMPAGTTAQRPDTPVNGMMRYNTDSLVFEGYINGAWTSFASTGVGVISVNTGTGLTGGPITSSGTISIDNTGVTAGSYTAANITVNAQGQLTAASSNTSLVNTFSGGTTGLTPATATTGAITLAGTLNVANGGTGANSLTGYVQGTGTTAMTASATIPVSDLTGTLPPANGGTGATTLTGYVKGTGVTAMTASATIPTSDLSGTVTNAQLANSSLTVGTTNIALGATSLTLGGLTSVAVTQDPTTNLQVATKQYVDGLVTQGISYHAPVYVESPNTAGNLNATYNNGSSGVGATLTNAGTQVALTIDGVLTTVGMRVLIYNQTNQAENGVYAVTTVGDGSTNWVLTRATDADTYGLRDPDALGYNDAFFVQAGATGAGETYVCTTTGVITFGTTAITFAQISAAQVYTAGNGLTLTGTEFSLTAPVTAVNGGSGQTSYTTGDLLYASNSTTLSKRAIGTEGYALRSSGGVPVWQLLATYFPITLHSGAVVTDIPIANGYFPVLLHDGVTSVNVTCY